MDKAPRVAQMRRYIRNREEELLVKIDEMSEEQLRWIVRLFADCLDETSVAVCLADYSEFLPLDKMQAWISSFIPQYTQLALADLELKAEVDGPGLDSLTDEELQSMSCEEKWGLLSLDEHAHTEAQIRRELARLLFCQTYDLYFDPSLPQAAIEFASYFEIRRLLAEIPAERLQALKGRVLFRLRELERVTAGAQEGILRDVREEIARTISLEKPLDALFEGAMERIPLGGKGVSADTAALGAEPMSREDLQLALKTVTDLMSLEEMQCELSPVKARYPSFHDIPDPECRDLVTRLSEKLGGRTPLSFTERYRSGRMVTRQGISSDVWTLLPEDQRLRLLLEDNAGMDLVQMARHLSRVFMSYQYGMLHDPAAQVSFLNEPLYHALQERIVGKFGRQSSQEGLRELNRAVTARMLGVETARREDRQALLLETRKDIAAALSLPDTLLYPEAER
jgi:hypothetical protein